MFNRVLIANRGEIAVRIIATLRRMGIESVAVYSDVDRDALHVRMADTAVALGPGLAYLDAARLIYAARQSGAAALHPGYGFLSENPSLALGCTDAGIAFVGPPAEAMALMGDKIRAKLTVAAAGVPVVPGTSRADLDDEGIASSAFDLGLPVLIKPSAGGGGKGMRLVTDASDLEASIATARREAVAAFGDGTLLVERYVTNPRHIEMQIFADTHGRVVALGERECSLQRRHQKIVEEAPSPLLDDATRSAMAASAIAAARSCGYVNAGTVEFIVPGDRSGDYFFMEMNTRLQVEHPVTEAVLGVDLVEVQLRVAAGEALPWPDQTVAPEPRGHAVEARIYAEDPGRGFLPATGSVQGLRLPTGAVRVDSALFPGLEVTTDYDPMLAKVIAWGEDRVEALSRLQRALQETAVLGVTTNVGFLRRLVSHPLVLAGDIDTTLVERIAPDLQPDPAPPEVVAAAAVLDQLLGASTSPVVDPWQISDGWRVSGPVSRASWWRVGGHEVTAEIEPGGAVRVGDATIDAVRGRLAGSDELIVEAGAVSVAYVWARSADRTWLGRDGDVWQLTAVEETIDHAGPSAARSGDVSSPMPGTVLAVHVRTGERVKEGQRLVSVEAMKMEYVVRASVAGTVRQVLVKAADTVRLDQTVAVVERDQAAEGDPT